MRVALLASLDSYGQPILLRRQGAGGVGRVGAGGILKPVEVEFEGSWLAEAVIGQSGMEEARRLIGAGLAGLVAEDEEERLVRRIFENRLQSERLAVKGELGNAGSGQVKGGSDDGGDLLDVGWIRAF
jgi:hypothetical protein